MSNSELYNGGESEGIGERPSNPMIYRLAPDASSASHAAKKDAIRRHVNHLIRKGFHSILAYFGAIISMAEIGTIGAHRNNELELYFGEAFRLLHRVWEFLHFVWRENLAGARITVRDAWALATIWTSDKAGGGL